MKNRRKNFKKKVVNGGFLEVQPPEGFVAMIDNQWEWIVNLTLSHVEEILAECQKDVDFGAKHQQIVSTRGKAKCFEILKEINNLSK